jgi:hypothetical protein
MRLARARVQWVLPVIMVLINLISGRQNPRREDLESDKSDFNPGSVSYHRTVEEFYWTYIFSGTKWEQ